MFTKQNVFYIRIERLFIRIIINSMIGQNFYAFYLVFISPNHMFIDLKLNFVIKKHMIFCKQKMFAKDF